MLMAVEIPSSAVEKGLVAIQQSMVVGGWIVGMLSLVLVWYVFTRLKPFLVYIKCKRNPEELAFLEIDDGNSRFYRAARIKLGSLETDDMGTYRIDPSSARHIKGVTTFLVYNKMDMTISPDVASVAKQLWEHGMSWKEWERLPDEVEYYWCKECGLISPMKKEYDNDYLNYLYQSAVRMRGFPKEIINYCQKKRGIDIKEPTVVHCDQNMDIERLSKNKLKIDMGKTVDITKIREFINIFGDPNVDQLRGENMILTAKTEALAMQKGAGEKLIIYAGVFLVLAAMAYITIKPYLACEAVINQMKPVIPMLFIPKRE